MAVSEEKSRDKTPLLGGAMSNMARRIRGLSHARTQPGGPHSPAGAQLGPKLTEIRSAGHPDPEVAAMANA